MVIPTTDDFKIKNLENEEFKSLRPEFTTQIEEIIKDLRYNIPMKKINNVYLDGEALFGLVQSKIIFYHLKFLLRLYRIIK